MFKSIILSLFLPMMTSCDELSNLFDTDKDGQKAYLMTDGVETPVKEKQIINVSENGRELFSMQYGTDVKLTVLPDYGIGVSDVKLMYTGRFRSLSDILLPINIEGSQSVGMTIQGGIIAIIKLDNQKNPMYLRMFISSGDLSEGKVTIQCQEIIQETLEYGAITEITINKSKAATIITNSAGGNLNLFTLHNNSPMLKITSIFSGQKEKPMLTFCGKHDSIDAIDEPIGKWEEEVKIEQNGIYFSRVQTLTRGNFTVRMFIKEVKADGSIILQYQTINK